MNEKTIAGYRVKDIIIAIVLLSIIHVSTVLYLFVESLKSLGFVLFTLAFIVGLLWVFLTILKYRGEK